MRQSGPTRSRYLIPGKQPGHRLDRPPVWTASCRSTSPVAIFEQTQAADRHADKAHIATSVPSAAAFLGSLPGSASGVDSTRSDHPSSHTLTLSDAQIFNCIAAEAKLHPEQVKAVIRMHAKHLRARAGVRRHVRQMYTKAFLRRQSHTPAEAPCRCGASIKAAATAAWSCWRLGCRADVA